MSTTHDIIRNDIDTLGALRAQIADLQAHAKRLESRLKTLDPGAYEGDLFRVSVSDVETERTDWKAVAARLNPSRQLVRAYTTLSCSVRLTVSARRRDVA